MEIIYDGQLASPPLESPPSPADSIHSPPPDKFFHWHAQLSPHTTTTHQHSIASVVAQPLGHSTTPDLRPDSRPAAARRTVSAGSDTKRRPATPDGESRAPFSPRRNHRRGLSVIAAPIDHSDMASPRGHSSGGHEFSPLTDSLSGFSPVVPMPARFDRFDPRFDPRLDPRFADHPEKVAAAGAVAAELYSNANLQDILVMLAHKERQVLEARHLLDDAQQELAHFRTQVDAVLGPTPVPLRLPCRPRILPRAHLAHIGIHTLTYTPVRVRRRRKHVHAPLPTPPSSANTTTADLSGLCWSIDGDNDDSVDDLHDAALTDSALTEYSSDDSDFSDDESPAPRRTLSRQFVLALLGWVQCVIAMLPTHQRAGFKAIHLPRRELSILWLPDYPSSTQTFYGFLAYEH